MSDKPESEIEWLERVFAEMELDEDENADDMTTRLNIVERLNLLKSLPAPKKRRTMTETEIRIKLGIDDTSIGNPLMLMRDIGNKILFGVGCSFIPSWWPKEWTVEV